MAEHPATHLTMGERLRPYRVVLAARMRAQRQYRASFVLDIVGTMAVGLTEFAEVWGVFHNVTVFGGLSFGQAVIVFALSNLCFSIADMLCGHLDMLPAAIRAGQIDAYYVRPLPLLAQFMTSDISLRRIGRMSVALVLLAIGLSMADIAWSPAKVGLLAMSVVSGAAIFAALFTLAGGAQFYLVNGPEFTNSFTYGGSYSAQQPQPIYPGPVRIFFTFVIPTAFVAYLPTLALLDRGGDGWAPAWFSWASPAAAVFTCVLAAVFWRLGTRHYQGGGG